MKDRIIIFILILGLSSGTYLYAQTGPVSSQFFLGLPQNNPGLTGIDPFYNINLGYKQAWRGFSDESNTTHLNVFGQIRRSSQLDAGKNTFRISNPEIYQELKRSKEIRRKHGVGLSVHAMQLGFFRNITSKLYYAYHIPVTDQLNLSLGSAIGFFQQRIDFSGLTVRDEVNDAFYQGLISQSEGNQSRLLLDFGLGLYTEQFYFSLNGKSLVDQILGGDELLENFSNAMEFSVLGGLKQPINEKFILHPNLNIRYNDLYGLSFLGSLRGIYNNFIYAGTGIQDVHKLSFLFGIKAYDNLFIHYSYDHYMGEVRQFAEGTHEFTLVYTLFNRFGTMPYSW